MHEWGFIMQKIVIALEGIDGSGKSSTIKYIIKKYEPRVIVYSRTKKNKLIDRIVSCDFMRKYYMLQVPIYIYLSHRNYIKRKSQLKSSKIIIMDRCFLSNICYFYPQSLIDQRLFNTLMHFEPRLYPQKIFILDAVPCVAQMRDVHKKDLEWLINTRAAYLNTKYSKNLMNYDIEILSEKLSIEEKAEIISAYIQEVIKNGN